MLMFIAFYNFPQFWNKRFNTPHVNVYQVYCTATKKDQASFNTSHVNVYQYMVHTKPDVVLFQYIPC